MLWLISAAALAGSVYINDVEVTGLKGQTFEGVTVSFDDQGDIRIDAPGYRIEVEEPASSHLTTSQPQPEPAPPVGAKAEKGHWWLVTEDNDTAGHVVQVYLNGQLARTVRSGDEQIIEDVGEFLIQGTNTVRMSSTSTAATGGALYVYLGQGSTDSGTLVLEQPDVQFGLSPARKGVYEREYTLEIAAP